MTDDIDSASDSSTDDVDSDGSTTTSQTRWWLTNDVLALWLVMIGADAIGIFVLQDVPDELVLGYLGIVGTAVAWAFGRDAVAAWRQGE